MSTNMVIDNSNKSILARSCDPAVSQAASQSIPRMIGNPEYVFATDDVAFERLLAERKWSVIFFAPGACRFSAAGVAVPGSNEQTKNWSIEDYKDLVHQHQGESVGIVETMYESESVGLLAEALSQAAPTR